MASRMFLRAILVSLGLTATPAIAEDVANATSAELRLLDKVTGEVSDIILNTAESRTVGHLTVVLNECRYPIDNPSGNAYGEMTITYRDEPEPVFAGWMIASAPALNAMDHPRYDVWILRCITS